MPTCDTCKFYHPLNWGKQPADPHCYRHPRPFKVPAYHWCGDFKSKVAKVRRSIKTSEEFSKDFGLFWDAYPKKKSPDEAWRTWSNDKIISPLHHQLIIKRATEYAQYVKSEKKEMKYVKHPSTWLKSGDWRQEVETNTDPKDCIDCHEAYKQGFKYTTERGKKSYRCPKCQEIHKKSEKV
jgi:predicted Zn-ribbon and HTH transcriptional regulator